MINKTYETIKKIGKSLIEEPALILATVAMIYGAGSQKLQRARLFFDLESSISKRDFPSSSKAISKLETECLVSQGELASLEKIRDSISEPKLYDQMRSLPLFQRVSAAEQYLQAYPDGENRDKVAQELLSSQASLLLDDIRTGKNFEEVYGRLIHLVSSINRFPGDYTGSSIIPLEGLIAEGKKYLADKEKIPQKPQIGDLVRVSNAISEGWNYHYFQERQRNVPLGSIGKVEMINANEYRVKFPQIKDWNWGRNWDFQEGEKQKNFADYFRAEISLIPSFNDLNKQQFQEELVKLRASWQKK